MGSFFVGSGKMETEHLDGRRLANVPADRAHYRKLNWLRIADHYDAVMVVPFIEKVTGPGAMKETEWYRQRDSSCGVILNLACSAYMEPPVRQRLLRGNTCSDQVWIRFESPMGTDFHARQR